MTNFSKTLQSSVNTVVPGLLSLKACAAGSHISIAQRVSEMPEDNEQLALKPPPQCVWKHSAVEDVLTRLVEAFRKSTAAREHIKSAIFGHFKRLYRRVLWFLHSFSFAFT